MRMTAPINLRSARAKTEFFERLNELFDKPEKWTKGTMRRIRPDGESCWCFLGGIEKVLLDMNAATAYSRIDTYTGIVANFLPPRSTFLNSSSEREITAWNDDPYRSFTDIKEIISRGLDQHTPQQEEACF